MPYMWKKIHWASVSHFQQVMCFLCKRYYEMRRMQMLCHQYAGQLMSCTSTYQLWNSCVYFTCGPVPICYTALGLCDFVDWFMEIVWYQIISGFGRIFWILKQFFIDLLFDTLQITVLDLGELVLGSDDQ